MLILLAIVAVGAVVEIVVMIEAVKSFGGLEVLTALVLLSAAGAWVVKYEGLAAMRKVGLAVKAGRMPTTELIYGLAGLVAGILLFVPGFITGLVGLLLAIPPLRRLMLPLVLALVSARVSKRIRVVGATLGDEGFGPNDDPFNTNRRRRPGFADDDVIDLDAEEYFIDEPAGELNPGEKDD